MKDQINTIRAALAFLDARFGWAPGEAPAIDALRAALPELEAMAGSQEPICWAESDGEGGILWDRDSCFSDDPAWFDSPMPLYAAPVTQQYEAGDVASAAAQGFRDGVASVTQQPQKLEDVEQYRMQMAGISTAAIGYWKEGDSIHPDYDTLALRDVAKLYAKYDALYKAQQPQAEAVPPTHVLVPVEPTPEMIHGFWGEITNGEPEIEAAKEAWRKAIDAAIAQQKGGV